MSIDQTKLDRIREWADHHDMSDEIAQAERVDEPGQSDPLTLAITGHRGLPDEVAEQIKQALTVVVNDRARRDDLVGVSLLADGPDTWFARTVIDAGGSLTAVVPAREYRDGLPAAHHAEYDELFARASAVEYGEYIESTEQAHMDASARMLDQADELLAVWDGQPARGYGGTADVVAEAQRRGIPVTVVWPAGARRD